MELQGRQGPLQLTDDLIAALQKRYPTRAVKDELLKAHLWLTRYEKRRPINVWRFVDNWLERAPATVKPPTVVNAWWTTDERTINMGASLGLQARPGESMAAFRDRIAAAVKAA